MKGFASKTDSMTRPSSKLGGSNLGAGNAGGLGSLKVGSGTNAQGDLGKKSIGGSAPTQAHEQFGSNTVAPAPGGTLAKGERKGPPGNA